MPLAQGLFNTFKSGVGKSTIDYIAVPESISILVIGCCVLQDEILNSSDHHAISAVLDIECDEGKQSGGSDIKSVKWSKIGKYVILERYTLKMEEYANYVIKSSDFNNYDETQLDSAINNLVKHMVRTSDNLP